MLDYKRGSQESQSHPASRDSTFHVPRAIARHACRCHPVPRVPTLARHPARMIRCAPNIMCHSVTSAPVLPLALSARCPRVPSQPRARGPRNRTHVRPSLRVFVERAHARVRVGQKYCAHLQGFLRSGRRSVVSRKPARLQGFLTARTTKPLQIGTFDFCSPRADTALS